MKDKKILKKFVITMSALGFCLVIIWLLFYYLTIQIVSKNASRQASAESEAIMSRIEDELQEVDETLHILSHHESVINMAEMQDINQFYDYGKEVYKNLSENIGNNVTAGDIILFGQNGAYYRLKGKCSNTVIGRIENILNTNPKNSFYISSNGMTYIGNARKILSDKGEIGYIVILLDKTKLEYIFSDYSDIDYIGIALLSDDKILCSNRDIIIDDIESIKNKSILYKEQTIGLTDIKLLVYCENDLAKNLERYFNLSLPVVMFFIVLIIIVYIYFWNKTMLKPQERELLEIKMKAQESELEKERTAINLLKKQISAHFTVNTMNVVRALINKEKKEEASIMCDELSCLLRYSNAPEEFISLMDECYVLEQYVGIMQVRYPESIEFNIDIDDYYENIFIPRMILQPIIENSIIHGRKEKNKIAINLTVKKETNLIIEIQDNGKGISSDILKEIRNNIEKMSESNASGISGIALINIQKRIKLVSGDEYGITIDSKEGTGTTVTVKLRIVTNDN